MWDGYEEDYLTAKSAVERAVSSLSSLESGDPEEAKELYRKGEDNLEKASAHLKSMEIELRSMSPSEKKPLQKKTREYKAELKRLQSELEAAHTRSQRGALLAGGRSSRERDPKSAARRGRLLDAGERLDRTSDVLAESRRTIAETTEIGAAILDDMHGQRETLLRSHARVKETRDYTSRAQGVLRRMARRAVTNKIILWCVIILLLAAIVGVIYVNWFMHGDSSGSGGESGSGSGSGSTTKKRLLRGFVQSAMSSFSSE
eukprot:PLAT4191.1.p1 GENE.PLAT4191.1~~PLAT4191.1.p1  ORF type:complete len:292 (-),score=99.24 PLAT4191.1:96-875(-)